MKAISYFPSTDRLVLKLGSTRDSQAAQFGRFKVWYDGEGSICAMAIAPFLEELADFRKARGWIHLGGLWKGIDITADDIKEVRADLLKKLEQRWEK